MASEQYARPMPALLFIDLSTAGIEEISNYNYIKFIQYGVERNNTVYFLCLSIYGFKIENQLHFKVVKIFDILDLQSD